MQKTTLIGEKTVLVPFTLSMVDKYAEWMSDPQLCEMTSSEPMSKADVLKVQQEYLDSSEKWIFIILDKSLGDELKHQYSELGRMAGDIDLFRVEEGVLEINFMVAQKDSRRKGLAQEAIKLSSEWAKEVLKAYKFSAKVLQDNKASQNLLEKMGFQEIGKSEKFGEIHYMKQL